MTSDEERQSRLRLEITGEALIDRVVSRSVRYIERGLMPGRSSFEDEWLEPVASLVEKV